jgi:hypothetical protein
MVGAPCRLSAVTGTVASLHRLAEQVLARVRWEREGRIGLQVTERGIATPELPGDGPTRVAVEGAELVVTAGERVDRHPLTTPAAAAALVGVAPAAPPVYPAATGDDPDEPLDVDPAVAAELAAWWWRCRGVLVDLCRRHPDRCRKAAGPTLWPEHFDLAVTATAPRFGTDAVVNLGAVAGDGYLAEPYAYVGPWPLPQRWEDPWWDAPFGRAVPAAELVEDAALADLFEEGLRRTG